MAQRVICRQAGGRFLAAVKFVPNGASTGIGGCPQLCTSYRNFTVTNRRNASPHGLPALLFRCVATFLHQGHGTCNRNRKHEREKKGKREKMETKIRSWKEGRNYNKDATLLPTPSYAGCACQGRGVSKEGGILIILTPRQDYKAGKRRWMNERGKNERKKKEQTL